MDDEGEPIAFGQEDRSAADFGGVWLVNGIIAILLIGLLQAVGWWEATTGDAQPVTTELVGPLLLRIGVRTGKGGEERLGIGREVPRQPAFSVSASRLQTLTTGSSSLSS